MIAQTKKCSTCGVDKTLSEFYIHKGSKFGFHSTCKMCLSVKAKANPKDYSKGIYNQTCKMCNIKKPIELFTKTPSGAGYKDTCLECTPKLEELKRQKTISRGATQEGHRLCSKCGEEKLLDRFVFSGGRYEAECKDCVIARNKIYYADKAKSADYNPSVEKQVCTTCNEEKYLEDFAYSPAKGVFETKCKACRKSVRDLWNAANPELAAEKHKKWILANPIRRKETTKIWNIANRDKKRVYAANRRALKESVPNDLTKKDIDYIFETQKCACKYCGIEITNRTMSVDHIFPLVGTKGNNPSGHGTKENIQILCGSCNYKKSNTDPIIHESKLGILTERRYMELLGLSNFMFGNVITSEKYDSVVLN